MQKMSQVLVIGFALLVGMPMAQAATTFVSTLSGANENPAVISSGTGSNFVILDSAAHTLRVSTIFSGLNSNTTASHIHCCVSPPNNAGVATTTPSFVGFPLGVTSGSFDQTYDMTLASSWNPAFITANGGTTAGAEAALTQGLFLGRAYLNIHTTTSPGGEIRGFLVSQALTPLIPTLSQWIIGVLALLLVAGTWVAMRRRSK